METRVVAQFAPSKLFISLIFLLRILKNFRYIISNKNFEVLTEKKLFCQLSAKACHRPPYKKAVIMFFWYFLERFFVMGYLNVFL